MLPTRAYADTLSSLVPNAASRTTPVEQATIVLAIDRADVEHFTFHSFIRVPVHTTGDAVATIERTRPRVVIVDWDCPAIDGEEVLGAAQRFAQTGILVSTANVEHAPSAIKAGCHSLLLKPFAPNLAAGRIGRLCRDIGMSSMSKRASTLAQDCCTHRTWPSTACPRCQTSGATSFEYSSYRRMWYACLACDHVWLGPRQE
jgi:DNA-binding response OmpR family regulator